MDEFLKLYDILEYLKFKNRRVTAKMLNNNTFLMEKELFYYNIISSIILGLKRKRERANRYNS